MTNLFLRHYNPLALVALALLGLALGHLGASAVGMRLSATGVPAPAAKTRSIATKRPPQIGDYEPIVQRSLFAPELAGRATLLGSDSSAETRSRTNLILLGTVAGGMHPLALTRIGTETKTLHTGDSLPDGGIIVEIARQLIKIRYPDGSEQLVTPPEIPVSEAGGRSPAPEDSGAIRATAGNRWAIPRAEADKARANLGELLKQARMEPNLVNGRTEGFEVKMIKPNTIFTTLGLQKGDIVRQVNGLNLDGPEKALQVFQQLREARHIVIALERNGSPMTFEYDLE